MELRHRGNRSDNSQLMESFQILENPGGSKDDAIRDEKCLSAVPTLLATAIVFIVINVFVCMMDDKLPGIVEQGYDSFVAKRAMSTLVKLSNLGPRPVGSYENEVLAFNLLNAEIEGIVNDAENVNNVTTRNQKVSGSFVLNMKNWRFALSYEDLQNVVVKLDPGYGSQNESILLNCHFDSVAAGPGVSDNGVNCAVMVELLRILAKSPDLRRPVIFLFNGGEEIMLQASHGFVTQHPWSRDAKYVVNLDSCGAGGREILFQTTRSDSYLVDLYARAVPHPYGQVIGEELFQSGLIPSDTDFRIFRDFGNMSGLDLAHYKNGYVYHTRYDNLDRIGPVVLQNTGDNLFALVKAMSSHNATAKRANVKYVFFDVLGLYMFSYTELSGAIGNFVVALVSFFSVFLSFRFTTVGMNRREYSVHLLISTVSPVCTFFLAVFSCVLVAFLLDLSGNSMSWYDNKMNLFVYYATAALSIVSVTAACPKNRSRTDTEWTVSLFNGIQLFWTILLFVATMAGLRSSYLFTSLVLFPAATSCVLGVLDVYRRAPKLWITAYTLSLFPSIAFILYLTEMFISLFAPITGRLGPHINPDFVVGALIAMSTYATVGYLSPVITLVKKPLVVLTLLAAAVLLSAAVVVFSPLGFPYSTDGRTAEPPKPERFDVIHVLRTYYDFAAANATAAVRRDETGYSITHWDRRGGRAAIAKHVPAMNRAVPADCDSELLCGSPFAGSLALHSSWIPSARPPPTMPPSSRRSDAAGAVRTAVTAHAVGGGLRRLEFTVIGPERTNVYVSPYPGTRLTSWSLADGPPQPTTKWQGNDVYVIRHSRGVGDGSNAWRFWLEQHSDRGFDEKTINVTVAFNWIIHGNLVLDDEFKTFLNSFPPWAHVNHAVANVNAYIY